MLKGWLAAAAALLLLSCDQPAPPPDNPRPALWEVSGPTGEKGWLFGTVHALPDNYDWQTPAIRNTLAQADELVLELGRHEDRTAIAAIFTELARAPAPLPPLSQRVPEKSRPTLLHWMKKAGLADAQSQSTETWAAALMLTQAMDLGKGDGVEKGLLKIAGDKPVAAMEGARAQLAIFDGLAEQDQRDLLMAVLDDAKSGPAEAERLARDWRRGDMEALAAETRKGLLADRELRHALLENRNLAWTNRIEARLKTGQRSFIAVGAAHLAGSDGVPALLEARGWQLRRIQ